MKVGSRFLVILLIILFGIYLLLPSIQWYLIFNDNDRFEASLSGINLRNEINSRIKNKMEKIKENNDDKEVLDILRKALKKEVNDYNNVVKKMKSRRKSYNKETVNYKDNFTFNEIKNVFIRITNYESKTDDEKNQFFDNFIKKSLENHFEKTFEKKKKVKQDIIKLGLDLQGGTYAVVTLDFDRPNVKNKFKSEKEKADALDNAVLMLENRINKFGVSETTIQKIKDQNKIVISLPGVKEATDLRKIVETTGVLEFKVVSKEGSELLSKIKLDYELQKKPIFDNNGNILPEILAQLPPDTQVLRVANKDKWGEDLDQKPYIVVNKESLLGDNPQIESATVDPDNMGRYVINFTLKGDAVAKWAKATRENIGKQIAIILDDVVLQSPVVQSEIPNGRSQITLGNLSYEELDAMAKILRSGSLNVPMEISEENTVGASLGRDSIQKGIFSLIIGFLLVVGFMLIYYNLGGLIANIALLLNLFLLIAGLDMFNATLTLPGIAGIVLTLGMAVDSNVIIYERVKEELRSGKTFNTAIELGYEKAFWTIMDSNITTFLAAIGISIFGTGAIKGFAVTLCMGIVSTLITSLFITKAIWLFLISNIKFKSAKPLNILAKRELVNEK